MGVEPTIGAYQAPALTAWLQARWLFRAVVADGVEPPQPKRLVYSQVGSPRAQCYHYDRRSAFELPEELPKEWESNPHLRSRTPDRTRTCMYPFTLSTGS